MGVSDSVLDYVAQIRDLIAAVRSNNWVQAVKLALKLASSLADDFLADSPLLKRSLQLRTPYMDPLNHLQVELLRRHRAGESDERVHRGIHLTINGVAAGLRNSG